MGYIIIWAMCGLIAMYLYQQRGRSSVTGFLGGFLLGPLGIVLALVSPSQMPKCPHCAEFVKSEALVCKHCGRDLPSDFAATSTATPISWKGPLILGAVLILVFLAFLAFSLGPFLF